jgi:hypothetical protein
MVEVGKFGEEFTTVFKIINSKFSQLQRIEMLKENGKLNYFLQFTKKRKMRQSCDKKRLLLFFVNLWGVKKMEKKS